MGNVDTGRPLHHGALVAKYRGNLGGDSFNHNYNWWDPSAVCATGTPCDNNGHGTHTMGTMVGDDGDPGTNQIGVAPHATWIAAKGCETNSCSTRRCCCPRANSWWRRPTSTARTSQPNMRPDIVNNSWGNSNGGDTFYQATVQAWVASGIFPSFSSGNSRAGLRNRWLAGELRRELHGRIVRHQQRDRWELEPRPVSDSAGSSSRDIAAPGVNVRLVLEQRGLSDDQRHLDGRALTCPRPWP